MALNANSKVGSDIQMFDVRPYSEYKNAGWKEGFETSWTGFTSNEYYTNTMLDQNNYSGTSSMSSGNAVNSERTFSGWKFLYKPYSETQIQWVLLYIFVRNVTPGSNFFHRNCNLYELSVNGSKVVSMKSTNNDNGDQVQLSTGALTNKRYTSIGGQSTKYGQLVPIDSNVGYNKTQVDAGTTQVVFIGKFTVNGGVQGTANKKFNVSFKYANYNYLSYASGIKAIAKIPSKWSTSVNWSSGIKTAFTNGTFAYNPTPILTPSAPTVATISNGYVSYNQTITATGGKYVKVINPNQGNNFQWLSSVGTFNLSSLTFTSSPDNTSATPDHITARATIWDEYKDNWYSESNNINVQYAPKDVQFTAKSASATGITITYKRHASTGTNGYFNLLYVTCSTSSDRGELSFPFYSRDIEIQVSRNGSIAMIYAEGTSLGMSLNTEGETTLTFTPACYASGNGLVISSETFTYKLSDTRPQFEILGATLDYPIDANGISHIIYNRSYYKYEPCVTFSLSYDSNVTTVKDISAFVTNRSDLSTNATVLSSTYYYKPSILSNGIGKILIPEVMGRGQSYIHIQIISAPTSSLSTETVSNVVVPVSCSLEDYTTNKIKEGELVDSAVIRNKVLSYAQAKISNYETIINSVNNAFTSNGALVWDQGHLKISEGLLVTTSIKELLTALEQFYTEITYNNPYKVYYKGELSSGQTNTLVSPLVDDTLGGFINYNNGIVTVSEDSSKIKFYDNSVQYPSVVNQNVQNIELNEDNQFEFDENSWSWVLSSLDDLIIASQVTITSNQLEVFNNYQKAILYIVSLL